MLRRWLAAVLALALALCGLNALAEEWEIVEATAVENALAAPEGAESSEEEESPGADAEVPVEGPAEKEPDPRAVKIGKAAFPDAAFRQFVAGLDGDGDGMLSGYEADMTVIIDVSGKGVARLDGIRHFTKLEYLYCRGNKLTGLDVSGLSALKYLDCHGNRLKKLNLGKRSKLEYVDCGGNKLQKLDVSGCRALAELNCAQNRISKLNLKKNTALVRLDCRQNKLKSIDVSKNDALMVLACQGNKIYTLDIRKLPAGLLALALREDLNDWDGDAHYWVESDAHCMLLPISTKVTDGKKLLYRKGYYLKHKKPRTKRSAYRRLKDAQYANFRESATTGMGLHALYRGASPLATRCGRTMQAMKAVEAAGIRTIINMSSSMNTVTKSKLYAGSCYASAAVWARQMNMMILSTAFRKNIASICRFMVKNEGPYYIHCIWGKDRTGFMCALLECLMGAGAKEVVRDYQVTYENFYGIRVGSSLSEYVAYNAIRRQLAQAFGIGSIFEAGVDLAACAEGYLLDCGLSEGEIDALKARLATDYPSSADLAK